MLKYSVPRTPVKNCKKILGGNKLRSTPKSYTRLYKIWVGVKSRCLNENDTIYDYYGGRGIRVCGEWLGEFENFERWSLSNDYNEKLTLDRIDVNADYSPDNCRWVNRRTQSRNTRRTKWVTIDGEKKSLSEWSEISGINYHTLHSRLESGWDLDEIFRPTRKGGTVQQ